MHYNTNGSIIKQSKLRVLVLYVSLEFVYSYEVYGVNIICDIL